MKYRIFGGVHDGDEGDLAVLPPPRYLELPVERRLVLGASGNPEQSSAPLHLEEYRFHEMTEDRKGLRRTSYAVYVPVSRPSLTR